MQFFREESLAICDTLLLGCLVKLGVAPGRLVALDDECAIRATEWIGMNLEEAVLVLAKEKGKGVQHFVRAVPDILRAACFKPGFADTRMSLARRAIDAIGRDEQIALGA